MKKFSLISAIAVLLASVSPASIAQSTIWTGSWAAAPVAAPVNNTPNPEGETYRNIVHLSLGGNAIRLRISNEFGTAPLTVAGVHTALSGGGAATQSGTDHTVTFGGTESVTIPTGSVIVSDPVAMPVKPFTNLAVSLFVPAQSATNLTYHQLGMSTNYIVNGNLAAAADLDNPTKITSWYLLKAIEVDAGSEAASIVILGASISEGYNSTRDKNARWPDLLAARLETNKATSHIGILNQGISGGRLLHDVTGPSALSRLDRDVLAQPNAKYVIIAIGTNDIGRTYFPIPAHKNEEVTAEQLIWGYQQIASRAHARGIKVIATTLNPFGGAGYYNTEGEQIRKTVNTFLRTSKAFDGVIDFDKITQDPSHPENLLPTYDSGDHLHPNDAGYKAMGDSIDLNLFTK